MQQGLGYSLSAKIAKLLGEMDVNGEACACHGMGTKHCIFVGKKVQTPKAKAEYQHNGKCWKEPPYAGHVKGWQHLKAAPGFKVAKQPLGNDKSGNNKKDVHPKKAAGKRIGEKMKDHHQGNG